MFLYCRSRNIYNSSRRDNGYNNGYAAATTTVAGSFHDETSFTESNEDLDIALPSLVHPIDDAPGLTEDQASCSESDAEAGRPPAPSSKGSLRDLFEDSPHNWPGMANCRTNPASATTTKCPAAKASYNSYQSQSSPHYKHNEPSRKGSKYAAFAAYLDP